MSDDPQPPQGLEATRWFPNLRAILVALHLIAILLMAAPAPVGGLSPATTEAPSVRALFEDASALTGWPAEDIADGTWAFVGGWLEAREAALAPFKPYYRWAGTRQSWRMMALINRRPARLRVEVNGALVYRTGDPDARWMAPQLESSRIRGIIIKYSWRMNRRDYDQMMAWLADEAEAAFGPDATFRACMERVEIALPGEETRQLRCGWEVTR